MRKWIVLIVVLLLLPLNVQAASSLQPTAPYYATFFYVWSENPNTDTAWSYWSDNNHTPPDNWFSHYLPDPKPNTFDPATELYSANNDATIYWQLKKLAEAKQEVAISSWWGQGHKSDIAFNHIITDIMNRADNPYPNLRWAAYYEKEGFGNPTVTEIVSDLNYIKSKYTTQNSYFTIGGKPVIFVYNAAHSGSNPTEDAARWQQVRQQTEFYIVMKDDPLNAGVSPSTMDGWHEYAPANRSGTRGSYFSFVSPGFWLEGTAERLPRDLTAFENGIKTMVGANVTWKLTETWNEWGEGSSVEPGVEVNQVATGKATIKTGGYPFENRYIDVLSRNLPNLENGTGSSSATITPTYLTPTITSSLCALKDQGDADCNAKIELIDFEIFRREFIGTQNSKQSDFNLNGVVDIVDYEMWRRGFLAL